MTIPKSMNSMIFESIGKSLNKVEMPIPQPERGQVLLKVHACGICRTDLHIMDGELSAPKLPLILGHQVVGTITQSGPGTHRFPIGTRVGLPWLGATDGNCPSCQRGQENLCDHPTFTGYHVDGGFADYTLADERFCFPIPGSYTNAEAAPLLCAGLIGYRTYRMSGDDAEKIGIFGFGAAAHLVSQVAKYEGRKIYAFTRPGNLSAQDFALRHGADWVGDSNVQPPEKLDAALIFAPVGALVIEALKTIRKGGKVICGGIHMSDIPTFPYSLLWEERTICSVANLTRRDGEEFFTLAPKVPVKAEIQTFPLHEAQQAIDLMRRGKLAGAAVLEID
jgi:alcohol dehydrogenase, propanol-preferring